VGLLGIPAPHSTLAYLPSRAFDAPRAAALGRKDLAPSQYLFRDDTGKYRRKDTR